MSYFTPAPIVAEKLSSENGILDPYKTSYELRILHMDSECQNQVLAYLLILLMTSRWWTICHLQSFLASGGVERVNMHHRAKFREDWWNHC